MDDHLGLVIKTDNKFENSKNIIPIDKDRGEFIYTMAGNYFFLLNNTPFFIDPFRNKAIALDQNSKDILFDFGSDAFPDDFFKIHKYKDQLNYFNVFSNSSFVWKINGFFDLGTKFYFQFSKMGIQYTGFFDKKNEKFIINPLNKWESNDPCFLVRSDPSAIFNDKLVYHLSKQEIQKIRKKNCLSLDIDKYDENNILMLVTFKK